MGQQKAPGESGAHGTGLPELVHSPAPSCFTTQRAGLPNLRWQTVTYITSRLADEDWWCLKGLCTQWILPMLHCLLHWTAVLPAELPAALDCCIAC